MVSRNRARSAVGVIVHRSRDVELAQPRLIDGIPCTGLTRTLLDLASVVSRPRFEAAVDSMVREQRVTFEALYSVLAMHATAGRNGIRLFREVLNERASDGQVPLSQWSRWVVDLLRAHGLPEPVMEYRIHSAEGGFIAQVDLAYPNRRLAIELDSIRWHHNRESFERDRYRRNQLTVIGWEVLNFTWNDYAKRPEALCDVVRQALGRSQPPSAD